MALSDSLEVAIGLSFIFFLASLVLASVHEAIETVLKTRGKYLFQGITELLNAPGKPGLSGEALARRLYAHPTIQGMMQGSVESTLGELRTSSSPNQGVIKRFFSQFLRGNKLPSYVPTRSFVAALIDQVMKGELNPAGVNASASATLSPVQQLRLRAEGIDNPQLREALIGAIDGAGGDIARVQANLAAWYDSAMDRVSGWYKRRSQRIIFVLGLVVAATLNVNTLQIANALSTSDSLRRAVTTMAEQRQRDCLSKANCAATDAQGAVAELERTRLPIGLEYGPFRSWTAGGAAAAAKAGFPWVQSIAGYLLTAFALMLGAPFWFDVLNRLMVIRATVKPTEKSKDEASQDPQPAKRPSIEVKLPRETSAPPAGPAKPPPPDADVYATLPAINERPFESDDGDEDYGFGPDGTPYEPPEPPPPPPPPTPPSPPVVQAKAAPVSASGQP